MSDLKALTIAPYQFLPASSGGQKAVYYLDQFLGDQLGLICVSSSDNELKHLPEPLRFTLLPLLGRGRGRYLNPAHFFTLKKLIKQKNIGVIIIEHPYLSWLGWLLKITTGKPLIIRSHNIEALRFKDLGKWWWRILADYERWAHRRASHSFFITEQDADYAVNSYGIKRADTSVITYGMDLKNALTPAKKQAATTAFKTQLGVPESHTLLLFNGIFGYPPNDEALRLLLEQIYPALLAKDPYFHLVVCGQNIPEKYKTGAPKQCTILGFVPDIKAVFEGAEVFLNPIWLGGGIKTKLVEALASGCAAVSFNTGAIGIPATLLAGKLLLTEDGDIDGFVEATMRARDRSLQPIQQAFLDYFDWNLIAQKAYKAIEALDHKSL